jgi:flagellar basal-body rod protein FlgB
MMESPSIPLFDLAEQRLAWVDRRQAILAQNIANADTPGWQPRDLAPFAAQLAGAGVALATTGPMQLPGKGSLAGQARKLGGERAPDGNGVKLDAELTKVADTQTMHDLVDQIYTTYLGFFKTAIGR